ncbi:ribonuclease H-like domain-containing protein, partial [Tanacetum coccineum]
MIAIRIKKFYKKTGRRVHVDGKTPVGFDKKKLECFHYHNTGHFARECTTKGTNDGKKKRYSFYQHQEAGKQEKNQMGLLTMDDGIVNWGEHTEVEETNHALMAISSSNEVSLCSKTCIDSYNTLKTLCDEQMNQLGDQEAQILAYSQAVKKLEAQLKTLDSWKDSSKNLWRLINSGMSSNKDSVGKPLYSRFTKTNDFKGVPTSGPQELEPNVSDDRSSEYSTCQSNDDSCRIIGYSFEHFTPRQPIKDQETPNVNRKNWNAMMERELEEENEERLSLKKLRGKLGNSAGGGSLWCRSTLGGWVLGRLCGGRFVTWVVGWYGAEDHLLKNMVDRGIFDSGCSWHMTGNKDQLKDFEEFNGGSVTFGGSKGYISGKGKIRVGNLDFDSVSFVKELGHFNLFSISQICDKQHKVLFTETECLVVSSDFKMSDENQILLKVLRHHNMYSFDMKTPTPAKGFACLIAKATSDESKLWHRRLDHINFKNLNKLVKGNLVRGLPSKVFKNDHTCVACHKGKQHRASCKAKLDTLDTLEKEEKAKQVHLDSLLAQRLAEEEELNEQQKQR